MFPKNKSSKYNYHALELMTGQLVLSVTLALSLLTSIGTFWIIFRLGLATDLEAIAIQTEHRNGEELVFNQNVFVDTIMPQESLRLNQITGKSISISESPDYLDGAGLFIDSDYISATARSFSSGNNDYKFKLSKKLTVLDVPHGIKNVKVIRAPSSGGSATRDYDLNLMSTNQLELSGNLGLKIHSRSILMNSPEYISIESKEDTITILAEKGLYLMLSDVEGKGFVHEETRSIGSDLVEASNRHNLCISRDTGMVFLAPESRLHVADSH